MIKAKSPDIELIKRMIKSPVFFIERIWGLVPQPLVCQDILHSHTKKCYGDFIKGKNITWQQYHILLAVERAIRGEAPKRISVASGHGIGKSALVSWIIHWFLFTRENAQIGCTAPTSNQIFDVLWKEIAIWHQRLPVGIKEKFEWSTTRYAIVESPKTWFARAHTARKEAPEAFAGLHGDHVALIADESSGVPDEIYSVGEGSLTNKDTLVVLISNPRRLDGFFYNTHHSDKANWQTLVFDSEESPIVDKEFVERQRALHGEDSDEWRYMVKGLFPKEGGVLEGGWMPLISREEIKYTDDVGRLLNPRRHNSSRIQI